MNKIELYWDQFCEKSKLKDVNYKSAFQFGAQPDWLANLVVEGKKTATCSSYPLYEMDNEPLPKAGEYHIVLDGQDDPVAIIHIESVNIHPMNEVSEEFALAEGEGDYEHWWAAHENFFTQLLKEYNLDFSPEMPVVCERFKIVYSKK